MVFFFSPFISAKTGAQNGAPQPRCGVYEYLVQNGSPFHQMFASDDGFKKIKVSDLILNTRPAPHEGGASEEGENETTIKNEPHLTSPATCLICLSFFVSLSLLEIDDTIGRHVLWCARQTPPFARVALVVTHKRRPYVCDAAARRR